MKLLMEMQIRLRHGNLGRYREPPCTLIGWQGGSGTLVTASACWGRALCVACCWPPVCWRERNTHSSQHPPVDCPHMPIHRHPAPSTRARPPRVCSRTLPALSSAPRAAPHGAAALSLWVAGTCPPAWRLRSCSHLCCRRRRACPRRGHPGRRRPLSGCVISQVLDPSAPPPLPRPPHSRGIWFGARI